MNDGTVDFTYEDCGSLVMLKPLTDDAQAWCYDCLPEDAPMFGGRIGIEPRYFFDILFGLSEDGFTARPIGALN